MKLYPSIRRVCAIFALVAAGAVVPAIASAAPPVPFPSPVFTLGCAQPAPLTLSAASAQSGPEANPPIGAGQVRFEARPAVPFLSGAGRMVVGWVNTSNGANGMVDLDGPLPVLSKTVTTGSGRILVAMFAPIDGILCQVNPSASVIVA